MNEKILHSSLFALHFKVCVRCATFNHAHYITQTMDGFCMQQTNFPFICVIIDDASKDGEQQAIMQYLHDHFEIENTYETADYQLTEVKHLENPNCHFAVFLLKQNHYSQGKSPLAYADRWRNEAQYIAHCEGDDYWTDSQKLQRQADILDSHPEAMMVYTGYHCVGAEGEPVRRPLVESFQQRSHSGNNLLTLLRHGNYVMTLTTMYRREVLRTEYFRNCPHSLDFGLTMAAALMGDFIWIPEVTGCYRSLQSGMVKSGLQEGLQKVQEIYRYYARLILSGQCKPLSQLERIRITTLILRRALQKKDHQLKKEVLRISLLSHFLLPIAFIRLKINK